MPFFMTGYVSRRAPVVDRSDGDLRGPSGVCCRNLPSLNHGCLRRNQELPPALPNPVRHPEGVVSLTGRRRVVPDSCSFIVAMMACLSSSREIQIAPLQGIEIFLMGETLRQPNLDSLRSESDST